MKYIKTFEGLFSSIFGKAKDKVKEKTKEVLDHKKRGIVKILNDLKVKNYTINDDYSVDVDGNVELSCVRLSNDIFSEISEIPVKFNRVTGYFDCSHNRLENLKNAPNWVGLSFRCNSQYDDTFLSLEGGPKYVGGYFDCSENINLRSTEYCPEYVGTTFNISETDIHELDILPNEYGSLDLDMTPISTLLQFIYDVGINELSNKSFIDAFQSYRIVSNVNNNHKFDVDWELLGYFIENQGIDETSYSNKYSELESNYQYWNLLADYNIINSEF